eukprot:gnl/TRDRNA2_/TRDRNA2_151422_c2_seq1.p1 gnl/TRDRNA2_/TRDRNA2_151422_c2~~gnl/TRDRNA2_/TRDRNA2_151422_c2_seq1.p1  ORF type:complete len:105 (-),score=13.85 gnl/TRDRNA2_/TRDRNA2_151422_c2_seq1:75-389(-)
MLVRAQLKDHATILASQGQDSLHFARCLGQLGKAGLGLRVPGITLVGMLANSEGTLQNCEDYSEESVRAYSQNAGGLTKQEMFMQEQHRRYMFEMYVQKGARAS